MGEESWDEVVSSHSRASKPVEGVDDPNRSTIPHQDGLETNDVGRSARGTRPNAGNFACITPEQWPSAALSKEAFNGKQPRGQDALLAESKELKPDSQPPIPALSPPSAAGNLEEAPCTTSVCCAEGRIRFRIRDSGWW